MSVPSFENSTPVLDIENLNISLKIGADNYTVIENFNLMVKPGQIVGLVGESGSGKSVLCLAAMGLLDDKWTSNGSLKINGKNILSLSAKKLSKIRGQEAAMIFQDATASLDPVTKIGTQLSETVRRLRSVSVREAKNISIELLRQVDIPDPERRYHEYSFQLSGGQNQRVMIASSLAGQPQLLFADEPTTALDVTVQAQITGLIKKIANEMGMGVVFVSHDLGVIANLCTDVVVMYAGNIVETGTVEQVLMHAQHPYTQGLINSMPSKSGGKPYYIKGTVPSIINRSTGCVFAPRCEQRTEVCETEMPNLTNSGENSTQIACFNPEAFERIIEHAQHKITPMLSEGSAVLKLENASCDYVVRVKGKFLSKSGLFRAVKNIDLAIYAGKSIALIGESGSGKSTLSKLFLGLEPCSTGSVLFEQNPVPKIGSKDYKSYSRQVQLIPQSPYKTLDPRIRIGEQIAEPMIIHKLFSGENLSNQVKQLLHDVKLSSDLMNRYPHELSGGQLQRVVIARALALKPRVLICDEPTSALDVSVQGQIVELLDQLRKDRNLAILFITHDLRIIRSLCDEVVVLYNGDIVEHSTTEKLFDSPQHPYTKSLLAASPDIDEKSLPNQTNSIEEVIV